MVGSVAIMVKSGPATFLFTDIEGSTRMWEEQEVAMRGSLARHDELLRTAVEGGGGEIVKMTGDGVHAAFDHAEDAIAVAAAAQRSLAAEDWGESGALTVRMAIHTGGAQARDGDYYGSAVNRAARLMSIAHGGQVLVSQATELLARDGLPADVDLRDLGEHRLRDLTRPERVFQLVAPGLGTEFPPIRSLDAHASNLPVQLTSFVGRGEERAAITDLLDENRMVTIIGVGGVGKTRLALEVAAELVPRLRDGAWFCELAPATDVESMVDIVASTLGVIDRPGMTRRESVLDFLATNHVLLVLDNCEHLLDPAADLATDALRRTTDVRILATSREPLSVPGEQVWGLRSLTMPADAEPDDLDELAAADSVRLFVERARASRPEFALDAGNASAVAEVCRRLDGMPLAIELAAARVLTMQPAEIASRLDERFRLLSAGRRAAVERHQTLQATVDWSYSLLTDAERTVFARLAVFPASFDADAAAAVATSRAGAERPGRSAPDEAPLAAPTSGVDDGIGDWDVADALASLVAKSMLTSDDVGDGTTRFGMLETLRQYGRDRLRELGAEEIDERQRRHAAHYADLAAELGRRLRTSDEIPARRRVALEIENFRSAITWALEQGDEAQHQLAVQIAGPLVEQIGQQRALGFGWYVERCATAALDAPPDLRFLVLGGAAFSAVQRGEVELARELLDAAMANGVPSNVSNHSTTYAALGIVIAATDFGAALRVLREGADIVERTGDESGAAILQSQIGVYAATAGDVGTALSASEEGLARARRLGNPSAIALGAFSWAAARWIDDPDGARAALEESMALTERGASDVIAGNVLQLLARLQANAGNLLDALTMQRSAVRGTVAAGNRLSIAGNLLFLAEIVGNAGIEPEVVGVVEGIVTRSATMSMAVVGGREHEIHDRAIENARRAVGQERFDALLARGGAMSYEEAVQYAVTELDRIIAELE